MRSQRSRPLGLSEILDRAVDLLVRRFPAIVVPLAIVYAPFEIVQYLLVGDIFTGPTRTSLTRSEWEALGVDFMLGAIVYAVGRSAAAIAGRAAYESRSVRVAESLRGGVRRVAPQFALFVAAFAGWAGIVVVGLIAAVFSVIVSSALGLPRIAILAVAVLLFTAVALMPTIWLYLAYQVTSVRIATAAGNPFVAFGQAFRATADGRWRSLLAGAVLGLVTIGPGLVLSALAEGVANPALRAAITFVALGVVSVVEEALSVTFIVIYDGDLRMRTEGTDLIKALDSV